MKNLSYSSLYLQVLSLLMHMMYPMVHLVMNTKDYLIELMN
ncbi:hypothetical protein [uncultured Campylobacter sp.]|nr:hypothetical protein [uncultured Campylobacter sp.]